LSYHQKNNEQSRFVDYGTNADMKILQGNKKGLAGDQAAGMPWDALTNLNICSPSLMLP